MRSAATFAVLALRRHVARTGSTPRMVNLDLFERAVVDRALRFEPDHDEMEARAVMRRDAMNDSPAWDAYYASVGAHFDHGATRARRHPQRH